MQRPSHITHIYGASLGMAPSVEPALVCKHTRGVGWEMLIFHRALNDSLER